MKVPCIKANGYKERTSEMAEVYCFGQMARDTMGFGKMINFMEEEELYTLMEEYTMENGKQEKLMALESKKIQMEVNMKGIGLMIYTMDKE